MFGVIDGTRLPGPARARPSAVAHVVGLVLLIGGIGMVVSGGVDAIGGGPHVLELVVSGVGIGLVGLALNRATRVPDRVPNTSIFAAVTASWVVLSVASTIPYLLTGTFDRFDDALFESISGLTTTGASVLSPVEGVESGILFWRSMTQWFGGMGVIVLVVAVLPALRVGGLELLQAEAPGPSDPRLDPRVRHSARRLWGLYGGFTLLIATVYFVGGMTLFDAVNHSFTTISTGGFSTRDASFAHFDSAFLEWAATVFMFMAGVNFALYWRVLRGKPGALFRSTLVRWYVAMVGLVIGAAIVTNLAEVGFSHEVARQTAFTVVATATTTGYGLADYTAWAVAIQGLLLALMAIGAMAGSTAGGFKVIRFVLILDYAKRELRRAMHRRLVRPLRIGTDPVDEATVSRIMGFTVLFLMLIVAGSVGIAAFHADLVTAASAATTSMGNVGPGLGAIGPTDTFLALDPGARVITMGLMLLGRLEIFPVLLAVAAIPTWRARRRRDSAGPR
ncbi:MAG TPA: TrkH family potassium uptake protein [Acidimicrobiia bacterium]|nr:TrkH family potassium uptake protein [Acidimicrobiia bacterium]